MSPAPDFAPRIVAEGSLLDFQQSAPARGHADLALGLIKLEWTLFEGGKRIAQKRVADAQIRETQAQAESIADTIAFQVTEAYRQMIAARKGIERSRPAVEQARETYRLVLARDREGDAIPAEVTDAEAAPDFRAFSRITRNSTYDYFDCAWPASTTPRGPRRISNSLPGPMHHDEEAPTDAPSVPPSEPSAAHTPPASSPEDSSFPSTVGWHRTGPGRSGSPHCRNVVGPSPEPLDY